MNLALANSWKLCFTISFLSEFPWKTCSWLYKSNNIIIISNNICLNMIYLLLHCHDSYLQVYCTSFRDSRNYIYSTCKYSETIYNKNTIEKYELAH